MLYKYAQRRDVYLGYALEICRDIDDAEDLVQDLYIKLHGILSRSPEKDMCNGYIYLTLRSIWLSGKRKVIPKDELKENMPLADDHNATRDEINEILEQMPLFERELLMHLQQNTITSFAKFLGVNRKTVHAWKNEATELFETLWQKRNYQERAI